MQNYMKNNYSNLSSHNAYQSYLYHTHDRAFNTQNSIKVGPGDYELSSIPVREGKTEKRSSRLLNVCLRC